MSSVGWSLVCNFCGQTYEANNSTDVHDPCEAQSSLQERAAGWVQSLAEAYVDAQPYEDGDNDGWDDVLSLGNAFTSPAVMRDLIELLKEVRDS